MKKLFQIIARLLCCCFMFTATASEESFAEWISRAVSAGTWETGRLAAFTDEFTKRIAVNPADYEARILHALSLGLSLAENREAQAILARFGFSFDIGDGFSLSGALDSTQFWPASNELADKALEQCKPVLGQIIEDLAGIPESWRGMVLSCEKWPIDETITIDYADVQYVKSMCYQALGFLYLPAAYDIDVDYAKGEKFFTSHDPFGGYEPRIPVLSVEPSLTSDRGWENSAIAPVGRNELIDVIRVAFYGNKMYVKPVLKAGKSFPLDVAHEFYAELKSEVDGRRFKMHFDPWDLYYDEGNWSYSGGFDVWSTLPGLMYKEDGKIFVFDLPPEMASCKDNLDVDWMEIAVGKMHIRVESNDWGSWEYMDWEEQCEADLEDFYVLLRHLYAEQTGVFRKVRNKNHLIYSREYMRLALNHLKSALAADERRTGNDLRLIECSALEDYQYVRNRLYKYIDQATLSLTSVATMDISDFSYYRGTSDAFDAGFLNECNSLLGSTIIRYSFAPVFNGLSPREYLPTGITFDPYFSGVSVALNTMKDPTLAGIFPDANDALWYRLAATDEGSDAYITGTPRGYVAPSSIPINGFVPSDLYGNNPSAQFCTVSFDSNGGSMSSVMRLVKKGATIGTLPVPTRTKFKFIGWFTAKTGGKKVSAATRVSANVTYYARWEILSFKLVLHKNDGTGTSKEISVKYGSPVVLPGAAKTLKWAPRRGFSFMGWATSEKSKNVFIKDQTKVTTSLSSKDTLHIYAIWQLKPSTSYAVQYIRNDGSGSVRTIGFNGGVATKLNSVKALGFERRGYTFVGWATSTADARAKKVWKKDMGVVSQPVANGKLLQIYAIWKLTPGYYSIRFNKNDGTGKWRELGYKYGDNTTLPTIANGLQWSRAGYKFGGWATSAANAAKGIVWRGDKGVTRMPVAAGKTLNVYAIWKKAGTAAANVFNMEGSSPP